jgi:putative phage-type endonuclease
MITNEQREFRKSGIGGSDIAAIMGLSPYKTAYDVWQSKVGNVADEAGEAAYWGNVLEPIVAAEFAKRTGKVVTHCNLTLRHPEHEFMIGSGDYLVEGENAGVECKTSSIYLKDRWGEQDGTDEVPAYYLVQGQWYCAIFGWERVYFPVLIGGQLFRWFKVDRDDAIIDTLIDAGQKFWQLVQAHKPPEPQNLDDIRAMYRRHTGGVIHLGTEVEKQLWLDFQDAKLREAMAKDDLKRIELAIKTTMGEAESLVVDGEEGKQELFTWRNNKDGNAFDEQAFKEDHPGLYEQYVIDKEGSRVLRLVKPKAAKKGKAKTEPQEQAAA